MEMALKGLTPRQTQIVELRAAGMSHKEIEGRLGLAPGVSRAYLSLAGSRVGVDVRALVHYAAAVEYQDRLREYAGRLNAMGQEISEMLQKIALEMAAPLLQRTRGGKEPRLGVSEGSSGRNPPEGPWRASTAQ